MEEDDQEVYNLSRKTLAKTWNSKMEESVILIALK